MMKNNSVFSFKLETHLTRDIKDGHVNGDLTVIWRDWDKIIEPPPQMIYATSVNPGEIKGPHLHTKRDSYFVCISGKVIFIIKDSNGNYHELESSESEPVMIHIPKNIASAHINIAKTKSLVIALANPAWRLNDNEMKNVFFDDYDWSKWS